MGPSNLLSNLSGRWTPLAIGMTLASFVVAAAWMAWVISQGTGQVIDITVTQGAPQFWESEGRAFRYAATLLAAFIIAVAALVILIVRPPANRRLRLATGVVAGLEVLVFGFIWFSLVVMPFPA